MKIQKLNKLILPFLAGTITFLLTGCSDEPALVETVAIPNQDWSIGKYEVTQAQYAIVMGKSSFKQWFKEEFLKELDKKVEAGELTKKERAEEEAEFDEEMNIGEGGQFSGDNMPAICISWYNAMEFCEKLTAREREKGSLPKGYKYTLPTSAQWELACRAGTTTRFCSGDSEDDLSRVGWWRGNSNWETHPVGTKEPNAWGIYDMHGNVWEWCLDVHSEYRSLRVFRGGCCFSKATRGCESSFIDRFDPSNCGSGLGFRVVRVPANE